MKFLLMSVRIGSLPVEGALLIAQAADFPTQVVTGNPWVNAGIGGIAIALLGLVGYMLKQQVDERKSATALQAKNTEQLIEVINNNNQVINGNTEAIKAVCKHSEDMQNKLGDVRDRLLKRPCMKDE